MSCEQNMCLVDLDLLSNITSSEKECSTWKAHNFSDFWGRTLQEGVKYRLGTLNPHKMVSYYIKTFSQTSKIFSLTYLLQICTNSPLNKCYKPKSHPRSFDARTKWPGWVSGIEDQGWCGSSWALSTVQVFSDRLALMSQGAEQVELSAQQLLECNSRGQQACHGGHLDRAWRYLNKHGYSWRQETFKS
jgi:hypothetical protein